MLIPFFLWNNKIFNTYKLNKHLLITGGSMNEAFKINVYFDEKGKEIENLISRFLIDILEKKG